MNVWYDVWSIKCKRNVAPNVPYFGSSNSITRDCTQRLCVNLYEKRKEAMCFHGSRDRDDKNEWVNILMKYRLIDSRWIRHGANYKLNLQLTLRKLDCQARLQNYAPLLIQIFQFRKPRDTLSVVYTRVGFVRFPQTDTIGNLIPYKINFNPFQRVIYTQVVRDSQNPM